MPGSHEVRVEAKLSAKARAKAKVKLRSDLAGIVPETEVDSTFRALVKTAREIGGNDFALRHLLGVEKASTGGFLVHASTKSLWISADGRRARLSRGGGNPTGFAQKPRVAKKGRRRSSIFS